MISSISNRNGARMLQQKTNSAGMVKLSFWFAEFRQVVGLLNDRQNYAANQRSEPGRAHLCRAYPDQRHSVFNMVEKRLQDERCTILKGYCDVKLMALLAIKRWLWDEMEKTHNLTELYAARRRIFSIVMEVSGDYLAYIGLLFRESKHM